MLKKEKSMRIGNPMTNGFAKTLPFSRKRNFRSVMLYKAGGKKTESAGKCRYTFSGRTFRENGTA